MDPVTQAQMIRLSVVAFGLSVVFGMAGFGVVALLRDRKKGKLSVRERRVWRGSLGALLAVVSCFLWAMFIEADWLSVSKYTIETTNPTSKPTSKPTSTRKRACRFSSA